MAPQKKHSTSRARRNSASTAATLTDGTTIIRPELPAGRCDDDGQPIEWHALTVEWWDDLWASPMAAEYHSSDKHALFILAALVDQFWAHPDQKLAAEIRLQRVPFGLTPYDRRRLEWTIETAEESKDRGTARRSRAGAKQPTAKNDPRLALVQ